MNESPPAQPPAHLAPTRGRHLRSTSSYSQARQRTTDDLLSNLTPRTVVDAFRNPSGTLKACIDAATPTEQAFALRVAVAANSIHEWLEELSTWPWPAGGGSAGFEAPAVKRRLFGSGSELSVNGPQHSHQDYIGSLPAVDVATYERRLDRIAQELEELDIEEIKNQVLNNHIMPLSRPGTPMMDCGRSAMSFSSITRLDDLTALITATTVGALPMLSKLTKLMDSWTFRLLVLRRVPVFLTSLADAEVALQSGWNAIRLGASPGHRAGTDNNSTPGTEPATLLRGEFEVMKAVLGRKVAKAGHDLDAMLDLLEGQPDTLPEEWIERVDALEHGYSEWTVACERRIKETDLAKMAPQVAPVAAAPEQPVHQGPHNSTAPTRDSVNNQFQDAEIPLGTAPSLSEATTRAADRQSNVPPPVIKIHPTADEQALQPQVDYPDTQDERAQSSSDKSSPSKPATLEISHEDSTENLGGARPASDVELSDISECGALQAEHGQRPGSSGSEVSTVIHEAPSTFTDSFSSDELDHGTPGHRHQTDAERDDVVPGLPSLRPTRRSLSVSFSEKTTITELPSFSSPPGTPTTSVIPEDDDATEPDSPSEISISGMDDQLQQQISEILESVPAKIRLTREPPAINLNPPDFKMPTARRSSRSDAIPRSQSNMSMRSAYSRSATPSFTLAPAYGRNSRLRHQRSNQEIKLYHLSRSNGEAPIKLFIRCVGEHGERVMVRVGGGWADLGEYLKEYASHHLRRAAVGSAKEDKVEVKDIPRNGAGAARADSTPPSRPASAMDTPSPVSPLRLRKTRRPTASGNDEPPQPLRQPAATRPKTPLANAGKLDATPPSDASSRSRSSTRSHWDEEDDSSALGMAGPRAKQIEMSEESKAWVESVKEKVRIASSDRSRTPLPVLHPSVSSGSLRQSSAAGLEASLMDRGDGNNSKGKGGSAAAAMFGEIGKVGSTKRLFRRG